MKSIKYITQLSSSDISKMMKAGNIKAGRGLKVDVEDDSIKISINEKEMIGMMWAFIRSAVCSCGVMMTAKDAMDNAVLDPAFYGGV